MLELIGFIFLIAIGIFLLRFFAHIILQCVSLGVVAFIIVGIVTGICYLIGIMSSKTAWLISQWAFYIGTAISTIQTLFHPFDAISRAWNEASNFNSNRDNNTNVSNQKDNDYGSVYSFPCCGNCMYNYTRGSFDVTCNGNYDSSISPNSRCGGWQHY